MKHLMLQIGGPNEWADYEPDYAGVSLGADLADKLLKLRDVRKATIDLIKVVYSDWYSGVLDLAIMDTIGVEFHELTADEADNDYFDRLSEEGVIEVQDLPGKVTDMDHERIHFTDDGVFWSAYEHHGVHELCTNVVPWKTIEEVINT